MLCQGVLEDGGEFGAVAKGDSLEEKNCMCFFFLLNKANRFVLSVISKFNAFNFQFLIIKKKMKWKYKFYLKF